MKHKKLFFVLFACAFLTSSFFIGCGGEGGASAYKPTWIFASWSGGAKGDPTDRDDVEAESWVGNMCPGSSVALTNYDAGFAGLKIVNNCSLTVTYALCVSKGSETQPSGGLKECAEDPFDTPFSDLTFETLSYGPLGYTINATENLNVNVFFCSEDQRLTGPPLRCL